MEITIPYTVERVTVYPDRARVTCTGECEVTAVAQKLIFDDLPLVMDPDSVRVTGKGSARVRILSVDVARRHYEQAPAADVQALEAQIEQLEDEQQVLDDEVARWRGQAEHLNGLRSATTEYAKGISRGKMTIEQQIHLVSTIGEQDVAVRAALRELNVQKRTLLRRLQKLRKDLEALRAARPRQRFQAVVEIEALNDGEFHPKLTYVVRNAGWQPLYDLRLAEDDNGRYLAVNSIAQIKQNTGQPWQQATLIVSTARPALNQRLPELKPWFIDEYRKPQPIPRQKAVRAMQATAEADAPPPPSTRAEAFAAQSVVAEVKDEGTAVSFAVPGKVDISGDGTPHKTVIAESRLEAQIDYLAVPRHTAAVYRRTKVINDTVVPMLSGAANLFVDDEFIGKTRLDYTPAQGEIELLLGVEERITVERELIKRDVDKRFMRDERQLRYGYQIKLQNLLATAVTVEVQDQIPVSRHEQIKVKLESVQPEPKEKSELNLLEWRCKIAPDAEYQIRFAYSVQHPKDVRIAGLQD